MVTCRRNGEDSDRGSGKLEGRKAVITGGDSGIGRAVALAFAREGADVLISYLDAEEQDAQETVRLIEQAGRVAVTVPGDIRDEKHCQQVVQTAVERFGGIDILVNNAAYQMAQEDGLTAISIEQFDRVLKTNVYAMFWMCKYAVPHMKAGSSIINTSSIQAVQPSPELMDYALTKAAIVNFTKALATSLADEGIRVNSVAPGPIWTPLIPATLSADKVAEHGKSTPLRRAGQPAEVAPPTCSSPRASPATSWSEGAVYRGRQQTRLDVEWKRRTYAAERAVCFNAALLKNRCAHDPIAVHRPRCGHRQQQQVQLVQRFGHPGQPTTGQPPQDRRLPRRRVDPMVVVVHQIPADRGVQLRQAQS
jgi:NAD(P)-dependent dehydrogenase (short-subunit alcohol dehydrogenase family)